jgi:hypothetical protein
LLSVHHDGYVEKNISKHTTEFQITKGKRINRKQMHDNPPLAAAGFINSGDQAPLVNETNLDKTKIEYNIDVNTTLRRKDTEGKNQCKKNADIPPYRKQFDPSQMGHAPRSIISLHSFRKG